MFNISSALRLSAAVLGLAWAVSGQSATCSVASEGVRFGNYDPFEAADLIGAGYVHLNCDAEVAAEVSLSAGSGSFSARHMGNGQSQLAYNLHTDPQRLVVWGDGTGGSSTVTTSAQLADIPIYGAIGARQNVTTGSYDDTIIITVTY
jgi:spore coat protein U-like protein